MLATTSLATTSVAASGQGDQGAEQTEKLTCARPTTLRPQGMRPTCLHSIQLLLRSLQAWLHCMRCLVCPLAVEPAPGVVFQQRIGCWDETGHPCIRNQKGLQQLQDSSLLQQSSCLASECSCIALVQLPGWRARLKCW